MLSFMDQVTHDRARSRRFLPLVGSLFPFILVSNWLGLLPGVGTLGLWGLVHGERELIPLFRPATSDLNMTLAMSVLAVLSSHVIGIMTIGFFKYGNKFIQLGSLWKAVARIGKVPAGKYAIDLFAALVEFMVGLIELVSEAAKVASLSLRLFGNIFAGEVLIHVLSSLVAYVMPTPFMFLEIIVGIVQALVFSMLTLVYLTIATDKPHGDESHDAGREPAAAHAA
jgi:F-type H+-transporting ATPase subunit a